MSAVCAAPDCANPVVRRGQTGPPPIYCSPACRPSRTRRPALTIEIEHDATDAEPGREWIVRLRRGQHTVVVGDGLGRFSATALAAQLQTVLPADINAVAP